VFSLPRARRKTWKKPLIPAAIDSSAADDTTHAAILEGKAELLREPPEFLRRQFTWIYARYVGKVGEAKSQEWIDDPENTLIKLVSKKVITWHW